MPYTLADNSLEQQFPGVNPQRHGMVPFSAQRFHLPVATPQDSLGILGHSNETLAVVDSMGPSTVGTPIPPTDVSDVQHN